MKRLDGALVLAARPGCSLRSRSCAASEERSASQKGPEKVRPSCLGRSPGAGTIPIVPKKNILYYGDNLDVLRRDVKDDSVDVVYLDPPFNSNRLCNVLFGQQQGHEAQAQIQAFDDTWTWTPETERVYAALTRGGAPPKVADAVQAMYRLLGPSEFMAYLVMMAPGMVELWRVLKWSGSIYLHCDPTASHYSDRPHPRLGVRLHRKVV